MTSVFDRGDIITVDFDPSLGHEQKGRRPAIVLTKKNVNRQLKVSSVAPISTGANFARDIGFAVTLTGTGLSTTGVIRCDQVQMLDLSCRNPELIEKAPDYLIDEVLERVISLYD